MLKGSQDRLIGVAITPHIGVEMVVFDKKAKAVHKYTQMPLGYNAQKREIDDYNALKGAITEMCKNIGVDPKSKFYLVLPNVLSNFIELPTSISSDEIESIITAKVEESYLFRKLEPVIAYTTVSTNLSNQTQYLAYSAISKEAVEKYKDVFTDVGGQLVGIETSNTATIRGLELQKIANDVIEANDNWNVLLVSSNNYALFALKGSNIIDYAEIPIAIKSLSIEEAYQAVATSVSQNLPNYPARKLIIASQTDDISAEALKSQISFENEIEAFEFNKYAKTTRLMTVGDTKADDIMGMSLSAIGSGGNQISKMTSTLDFLAKKGQSSSSLPVGSAEMIIYIITAILALIVGGIWFGVKSANDYFSNQVSTLESEKQTIQAQVDELKGGDGTVRIEDLIPKINAKNKKAIGYYDSLSTEIPKNVWLTYVYLKDGENIALEGFSLGIDDIYQYYKGLKNATPSSTIQLKKLKMITDIFSKEYNPDDPAEMKLYDFEISNTVSKKAGGGIAQPAQGDPNAPQTQGGDPGQLNVAPPPPAGAPQLTPVNLGD